MFFSAIGAAANVSPEHELIKGQAEKYVSQLKVGEVIQFERFGFCRLDSIEEDLNGRKIYNFWFTHWAPLEKVLYPQKNWFCSVHTQ